MSSDQLPVTVQVIYNKETGFTPDGVVNKLRQDQFCQVLKEGDRINITLETIHSNGSYKQLSKIHKNIRILATEAGYSYEEMKKDIKKRSGLCMVFGPEKKEFYMSFGDCSKEELDHAIKVILETADYLNCNLHQI